MGLVQIVGRGFAGDVLSLRHLKGMASAVEFDHSENEVRCLEEKLVSMKGVTSV